MACSNYRTGGEQVVDSQESEQYFINPRQPGKHAKETNELVETPRQPEDESKMQFERLMEKTFDEDSQIT